MNLVVKLRRLYVFGALVAAGVVAGCSGGSGSGSRNSGGEGEDAPKSMEALFSQRVQPRMEFCRSCHLPGGVADVENGRDFQLSTNKSQDLSNLTASWERLGRNNPTSRILLMASGQETPHSGGAPWAPSSAAYKDMDVLLKCLADPAGCAALLAGLGGGTVAELPLLGSKRGGHAWFDYCEGKADAAALPVDPRSLIKPGVNQGRAVLYNAWWRDCHADPEFVGESPHPKTCGELREYHARGDTLMRGEGRVGAGNFFAGTEPNGYLAFPASVYSNLWAVWGLTARPDNFDQLVAERFGVPMSSRRNPYPLPGEDPNATDGGSGQLPVNMTQTRNADGTWSGNIGLTCHGCHSGQVGTREEGPGLGALFGSGTGLPDIGVIARDLAVAGAPPMAAFALFGASRGTNNAQFGNLAAIPDPAYSGADTPSLIIAWLTSGSTASMDTPPWWNMGHRPVKFIDGIMPSDAVRVDMAFYTPSLDNKPAPTGQDTSAWVRSHNQVADAWILSMKAPVYPLPVDTALAEQGAILFHSKDLWGAGLDNPVPRPEGGNGSCASCHGATSPRFAADPAFLETPALEGVASYIAPLEIIRTDPERLYAYGAAVQESNAGSFAGYPETVGTENDCGSQTRADLRGDRAEGYLAPPLYGIWATAPYLHNGSVPDVWGVLQPADRPKLWRRVSTPPRADQAGKVVMGFDTSLQRAYDPQKLGWKYDLLSCGTGTLPFIDCDPTAEDTSPITQAVLSQIFGNVVGAWNVANGVMFTQWTPQQIEDRKIYNTYRFSQGNGGHDFTAVLTDAERIALIEYLKTL